MVLFGSMLKVIIDGVDKLKGKNGNGNGYIKNGSVATYIEILKGHQEYEETLIKDLSAVQNDIAKTIAIQTEILRRLTDDVADIKYKVYER